MSATTLIAFSLVRVCNRDFASSEAQIGLTVLVKVLSESSRSFSFYFLHLHSNIMPFVSLNFVAIVLNILMNISIVSPLACVRDQMEYHSY